MKTNREKKQLPYFPDYKSHLFTKKVDCEKMGATYIQDFCEIHRSRVVESGIFLENVWPPLRRHDAKCRIL